MSKNLGMLHLTKLNNERICSNMRRSSRKALILNNFSSPYIYQAIVILSEDGAKNETKALKEAERIVSEYFANTKEDENEDIILYSRPKRSNLRKSLLLVKISFIIGLAVLVLGLFLFCR